MFEIWDETGREHGLTLPELQLRLRDYQGDVMVRYLNRLGLPSTLFLTIRQGCAYQRFKAAPPCSTGPGLPRPCTQPPWLAPHLHRAMPFPDPLLPAHAHYQTLPTASL